jgi:2-isopropylmalate synthase
MKSIAVYDTTLRDGTQSEEINLTSKDKLLVARKLDELGVHYIEGGWPGSNPTDREFFAAASAQGFRHAKLAAFGSTHAPKGTAQEDKNLQALVECGASVATIFGKTWDFHVKAALRISLEQNLDLIGNSLAFLKPNLEEVFFDAEHFFDGFAANPDYALACLKRAHEAGADVLVLCDTNGGTLPQDLAGAMARVREVLPQARLGIHCHNDSEMAVANSLEAVRQGAVQVQGTINGYGERCGNANLCSIIPNLELKMGYTVLGKDKLPLLTEASHYVAEVANLRPFLRQPFVGRAAFSHKGGIHVSAVIRDSRTYEHVDPLSVGNERKVVLSDLAGRSNILFKARQYGYDLDKDDASVQELLAELKERERMGYEYSVAEASYKMLFFRTMGWTKRYFQHINFRVLDSMRQSDQEPFSEATVMLKIRGRTEHTAATGRGPVNALDSALRRALEPSYPNLREMKLLDFKVRVLSGAVRNVGGTASFVRVLIESGDKKDRWTTIGVSHNIIEASWQALMDSINYKLFKDDPQKWPNQGEED